MKTLITHLFFAFCIIILSGCENDNSEPKPKAKEGTQEAYKEYPYKTVANSECMSMGKIPNENNDNSASKSYTVLEAIEGTWEACQRHWDKNAKKAKYIRLGEITIKDGLYQFDQVEGFYKEMFPFGKLNFFFDAPSGKVQIEYEKNINPNDPLEIDAPDNILATISFISEQEEMQRDFFIRINKKSKSLYFHSLYSELSDWSVKKEL